MRTTLALDDDLLAEAQRLTVTKEMTALIRQSLTAAATRLAAGATIWISDKRLAGAASQLGLAVDLPAGRGRSGLRTGVRIAIVRR